MKRRYKHGRIKVCLHQADAVAPQLIITVAARFDEQEPRHQQCIQDDDPMVYIRPAECNGKRGTCRDHSPVGRGIQPLAPDVGPLYLGPEKMGGTRSDFSPFGDDD